MTATAEADATTKSGVSRDAITYAAGGVAGKAAAVLVLPILARSLGPSAYGALDLIASVGSAATVILLLGFDAAATRLSFSPPWTHRHQTLHGTWLTIILVCSLLIGAFLLVVAPVLSEVLFGSTEFTHGLRLLAVIVPAGLVNFYVLTLLRISGRAIAYASLNAIALVGNALLALILVGILDLGLDAAIGAWSISLAASAIVGLLVAARPTALSLDREALRSLARYGLPLAPAIALVWIAEVLNRTILLNVGGTGAVGQLSVGLRVASIVGLASTAFFLAWQPRAFANASALRSSARAAERFIAAGIAMSVALALLARPIVGALAGDDYGESTNLVGLLALAALGVVVVQIIGLGSALALRSEDLAMATSLAAISSVALNAILAPTNGTIGTAAALAGGQLVALAAMGLASRRRPRVPLRHSRIWIAMLLGLATVVLIATPMGGLGVLSVVVAIIGAGLSLWVLRDTESRARR